MFLKMAYSIIHSSMGEKEFLAAPSGYALILRSYDEIGLEGRAIQNLSKYELNEGQALLFHGIEDIPGEPTFCQLADYINTLPSIPDGHRIQLLVLVDEFTGGLQIAEKANKVLFRTDSYAPYEKRAIRCTFGRQEFRIIWGETKEEVEKHQDSLREAKAKWN